MTIKNMLAYLVFCVILILTDQGSKTFFIYYLENNPNHYVNALPFLDIVYSWNRGVSFGLFGGIYSNLFFLFTNSIIVSYMVVFLLQNTKNLVCLSKTGLLLIISGALGNLIDRIFRNAVFDFIYFNYQDFYFPAFNFADFCISLGVVFFILGYYFSKQKIS